MPYENTISCGEHYSPIICVCNFYRNICFGMLYILLQKQKGRLNSFLQALDAEKLFITRYMPSLLPQKPIKTRGKYS